ncbi:MAG: hypothetical protein ACJ798_17995 [Phenylobacterium sp.]
MRIASTLVLIAGLGLAAPVLAQPAPQPAKSEAPPADAQARPKSVEAEADAALAMSIRMQKEQDARIARVLCASGDKDKCAQLANAETTPRTPSP